MTVLPSQLTCHIDLIENMDERTRYLLRQAAYTIAAQDTRITALVAEGSEYRNLETVNTIHRQRAQALDEQLARCQAMYSELERGKETSDKAIAILRHELAEGQSALDRSKNALTAAMHEKKQTDAAMADLNNAAQQAKRDNTKIMEYAESLETEVGELATQVSQLAKTVQIQDTEFKQAVESRNAAACANESNLSRLQIIADYLGIERSKTAEVYITAMHRREAKAGRDSTASEQAWQDLREYFGIADSLEPSGVASTIKNVYEGTQAEIHAGTQAHQENCYYRNRIAAADVTLRLPTPAPADYMKRFDNLLSTLWDYKEAQHKDSETLAELNGVLACVENALDIRVVDQSDLVRRLKFIGEIAHGWKHSAEHPKDGVTLATLNGALTDVEDALGIKAAYRFGFPGRLVTVIKMARHYHDQTIAKQMSDGDYSDLVVGLLAAKIDPVRLAVAVDKAAARA